MNPEIPEFLRSIAVQASAYQQLATAGDDAAALQDEWRRWAGAAALRVPGAWFACEQATASLGELSPGCQACKEGTWDCVFLTPRCNLGCSFCCSPFDSQHDAAVSAFGTDVETIAANYARTRITGVSFSGGEPFAVPERLLGWVQAFRKRFPEKYLWIYTNGLLANDGLLDALARLKVDELRFNAAASGYNHPPVLAAMRRAASIFPRVTVEIPAVPEDEARLLAALPAWVEAGVRYINLHELMFEPGTRSASLPGPRRPVRLPDGHCTEIHPQSSGLALKVMEFVSGAGLPLAVNYCSLLNKVGQVRRRRESLLPLTRAEYEQVRTGQGFGSAALTSCVLYQSPTAYLFCRPDQLEAALERYRGYAWARITRLAPLALDDRGGWVEFTQFAPTT